jgi:hypothetical protein
VGGVCVLNRDFQDSTGRRHWPMSPSICDKSPEDFQDFIPMKLIRNCRVEVIKI